MKLHSDQMISRYIFQKINERLEKIAGLQFFYSMFQWSLMNFLKVA